MASLITVTIIAFVYGAIIASRFANERVLVVRYGQQLMQEPKSCFGVVDSSRLVGFASDYRMVLVCGPADPTIDRMVDSRIVVSEPFRITGNAVGMQARMKPEVVEEFIRYPQWWIGFALVPKKVARDQYKTLEDVESIGGRVFENFPTVEVRGS